MVLTARFVADWRSESAPVVHRKAHSAFMIGGVRDRGGRQKRTPIVLYPHVWHTQRTIELALEGGFYVTEKARQSLLRYVF